MSTSLGTVFVASTATALATGLGALPFLFVRDMKRQWLGIGGAVAAGFMLGASSGMITEGAQYGAVKVMIGVVIGVVAIAVGFRLVGHHHGMDLMPGAPTRELSDAARAEQHMRRNALRGVMLVGVMTLHSFSEGVGVGVAYGGGESLGWLITVAIAVHNIPEGLAISLVLVPRGASFWKASGWSVFSSLPQPLMAVPAFIFVEHFQVLLPYGLGFAAGAMVWMSLADLIPDALRETSKATVLVSASAAIVAMLTFQQLVLG